MKQKIIIVLFGILFITNFAYALDFSFDKGLIKSGTSAAKDILSHDNTTRPLVSGDNATETYQSLNNWKSNSITSDTKAVSSGTKMYSLDGKNEVDTSDLFCIGNSKLAELSFAASSSSISMGINITGGQSISIQGIAGICAGGFTICDTDTNSRFCADSLSRTEEGMKKNHICRTFNNAKCRNWQINVTKDKKIQFNPLSGNCSAFQSAGATEFESLTSIVSASLSQGNLPIGNIETKGNTSILYSINSDNCTMGGGNYGSGYTDMNTLGSLYDSKAVTMPDASGVISSAMNDNDSVYNLIQAGQKIDYGGGSIGTMTLDKCEINNILTPNITAEEKESTFNGSYQLCTNRFISGRLIREGDKVFIEFQGGNGVDVMKDCTGASGADIAQKNDGWFRAYSFTAPASIKEIYVDMSISAEGICTSGTASFTLSGGAAKSDAVCSGTGRPKINWKYKMIYTEESLEPSIVKHDACKSMKERLDCQIKEESVCDNNKANCIVIIKDTKKTGNTPHGICYNDTIGTYTVTSCAKGDGIVVSSPIGSKTFDDNESEGWFNIQREYRCTPKASGIEGEEDFFSEIFKEIGGISKDVAIPMKCVTQYCVVDKTYVKNDIYIDASTSDTVGNGSSGQRLVKKCDMSGTDMENPKFVCKLDAGESIYSDCACDNEDQTITNLQNVMTGLAILDELKNVLNCNEDNATK